MIAPIAIGGLSSSLSTRNTITRIARKALQFKAEELYKYAQSQWRLLADNNLSENPQYVRVAKTTIEEYASSLVRSPTELFAGVGPDGTVQFSTSPLAVGPAEQEQLKNLFKSKEAVWFRMSIGGIERVGQTVMFEPFGWMFMITEQESTFYGVVRDITQRTIFILMAALIFSIGAIVLFTHIILKPLGTMDHAMTGIIQSGDLSRRVTPQFKDEIGDLAHRFNMMTGELQKAYDQIKGYAYKVVIARTQERKIRNIFQKYVPIDVLDEVFNNPESLLKGTKRQLAVLFSDIRGFTTISETLSPEDIVESLNSYFTMMVDVIMKYGGIVDKYIGDAIMAFFGAPVKHENDPEQATLAALEMIEKLEEFNQKQAETNKPQFTIGIGINYGDVVIGNIGSDKKMDYTVIGDMVNLASRLEGLTKMYHQPLLISHSIAKTVHKKIPCRLADRVRVKGKQSETKIYAPKRQLTPDERKGWQVYNEALRLYYKKKFSDARKYMHVAGKYLPEDPLIQLYLTRCEQFLKNPPAADWDGIITLLGK